MNERQCRALVYERADGRCEICGGVGPVMSYHHRKKRSHLPKGHHWDDPSNVVYVDGSGTTGHHGWIESNPSAAAEIGFHVRPWETPSSVPIKVDGTWYLLLPNGGKRETAREELATGDR